MKNLSIITITVLLFAITASYAQKDTLWFDKNWKETTKESARFYRLPAQKEGKLYRIKDFYIDGSIQMSGLSKYKDSIDMQQAVWYNETGHPIKEITYDNSDHLNGTCTYYSENKDKTTKATEELIYQDGKVVKTIRFDGDKNGIRYERYYDNGVNNKGIYYGKNGKKIGQATYDDAGYTDGKKVYYYYKPMRVKYITEYSQGKPVFTQYFYPNGTIRNRFDESTSTETFYDDQGNQLGAIQYQYEEGSNYKVPYEGKNYLFTYKNPPTVEKTKTYKKGRLTGIEEFNEQGILIKKEEYTEEGTPIKVTSYNDQGQPVGVLEKINDKLEGRIVESKGTEKKDITYKDGTVQEALVYYADTTAIFSRLKNSEITYFDMSGEELGTLKVKLKKGYYNPGILEAGYYSPTPVEGTLFRKNYKNKIAEKQRFSNEKLVKKTIYTYIEDNDFFKETELYDDEDLSKIITYYINGGKKSEVTYQSHSYRKKSMATFYDKTGKVMATYDYATKTGTEYKYFYQSDQVEQITQLDNGKLIKNKGYQKVYNQDTREYDYVLREDININAAAQFYSKEGELIAQATFTNQEPTGTIYDYKDRREVNVKNGLKEGAYQKFEYDEKTLQEKGQYVNDKKHGTFIYFRNGKKEKEENYHEGEKEGYTIYYDKNGKELSRLLYKKDKPFEGQTNFYGNEKTYKNGTIVKETEQSESQKTVTRYISKEESNTTIYDLEGHTLLTYNEVNHRLHGKVVQYKNDKPAYTAVFSKGKLTNGTVWVKADSRYRSEAYSQLSRENDTVRIKTYNKAGDLIFNGEINPALYKDYGEGILSYKLDIRATTYRDHLFILEQPD